jgi:hypothetical protein
MVQVLKSIKLYLNDIGIYDFSHINKTDVIYQAEDELVFANIKVSKDKSSGLNQPHSHGQANFSGLPLTVSIEVERQIHRNHHTLWLWQQSMKTPIASS